MDAAKLTLAIPQSIPAKAVTDWRVVLFGVERAYDGSRVTISVIAENNLGEQKEATYSRPPLLGEAGYDQPRDALLLLAALNTANYSTKSLHARLLEKLVADGFLGQGTVA